MLLSTSQVRQTLDQVTYKPGWKLTFLEDESFSLHRIGITATLQDARNPDRRIGINERFIIPGLALRNIDDFLGWLLGRLVEVEIHEAREFFLFKGEAFDSPHNDEVKVDKPLVNVPLGCDRMSA